MTVLSEERLFVQNQNTKESTFIKQPLELIVSLEAHRLETKQQEWTIWIKTFSSHEC